MAVPKRVMPRTDIMSPMTLPGFGVFLVECVLLAVLAVMD